MDERQSQRRRRGPRRGGPAEAVWQGDTEGEAAIVAGRLRTAGIRVITQGARQLAGGYPHAFQRHTWAVAVPGREVQRARQILRAHGHDPGIVEGISGEGLSRDQRATLRLALLLAAAIAVLAVFLPLYAWVR